MQRKHIVYLIEFTKRKSKNIMPYYYIGSKSNCIFDGTSIIAENNTVYFGSSKADGYNDAILNDTLKVHILGIYDDYDECIKNERLCHIANDVVADPRYWNLSYAMENTFSHPDYATVKHTITGKTVRLQKDHPMILSGEYVGLTKGMFWFTDGKNDVLCYPENAPEGWVNGKSEIENFSRGDNHYMRKNPLSQEEVMRRVNVRSENMRNNPEKYAEGKRHQREVASKTHKGVPKSAESNEKRSKSSKDYITLKNINTGECIRIRRWDVVNYDF